MFSHCKFKMPYFVFLVCLIAVLNENKIVFAEEVKVDCPPGYFINAITSYKRPEFRRIDG